MIDGRISDDRRQYCRQRRPPQIAAMKRLIPSLLLIVVILLVTENRCLVADAFAGPKSRSTKTHQFSLQRINHQSALFSASSSTDDSDTSNNDDTSNASKREMLKFAIPALGIYLTNPLLSNIDNAFVGRTVGALGLAALSPATLCIDQALYLFSFLSRATTGLASRAYSSTINTSEKEAKSRMKDAASPAFSVSIFCGILLSLFYTFNASNILQILNVDSMLYTSATSYIHYRGIVSWAAMSQAVLLSLFMVAKDAITPLKIISAAAILNVIGDALFCVGFKWGCGGAAAATSLATLLSSAWMVVALKKRDMMPQLKIPTRKECSSLMEFTGPLLAITLTRMAGFINMQKTAMTLGTESLAGYQLVMNLLTFYLLFGEPLSQLGQTKLPALIDGDKTKDAMATFKSIMTISVFAAAGVGGIAYLTALLGPGLFSSNVAVQQVAKSTAPTLFWAVAMTIMGIAVDGTMMASRDFGWMLGLGVSSFVMQAKLLTYCHSVGDIVRTFTLRLGTYTVFSTARALLGFGNIGRAIRGEKKVEDGDR